VTRTASGGYKEGMDHTFEPDATAASDSVSAKVDVTTDLTGQTLGDFQILRKLGQGGMGQVYLAQQLSLKRKVALKTLRADLAANSTALARFKAEAEAVAKATHANIVQVYAIHEFNGLHYMALEYVEGRNLRQYLEKKGPPEVMLALSIIRQVAAALQRATELGIVHRDIKPENILLTRKGEVKVADFGLSRIFGDSGQALHLTQSGVTLGTPLYMSPEQVEGKPVDPRTDIYSFGVTCYHLLAGEPPFRGQSAFDVAVQHVQKQPKSLAEIRPDLPPDLCKLVHRMMAKKPDERVQTGREIAREVARLRDTLVGIGATTSGSRTGKENFIVQVGPTEPNPTFDATLTQTVPTPRSSRRLAASGGVSLVLALGAGLVYGWWHARQSSDSSMAAANPVAPPPSQTALPDERPPAVPLSGPAAEEKRLLDAIQAMQSTNDDVNVVKYRLELGLFYLKDWRLDDAEKVFKEMDVLNKERKGKGYLVGALVGKGIVAAFRDRPQESNNLLMQGLGLKQAMKKEPPVIAQVLRNRPELAEMVAKALNHNLVNSPATFPDALRPYLAPPLPKVKTPG
jgi:serine/threonine-protein kinase